MTDKNFDQRTQANIHGDGNVVGDHNVVTVIKNFVQGVRRLPTDYGTRLENFLLEYLGTPDHPVPFGGRNTALTELDTWLADPVHRLTCC